jgi:uncharacterized surface protein with fasciclin (FAS1) repeats
MISITSALTAATSLALVGTFALGPATQDCPSSKAARATPAASSGEKTIVETAVSAGKFNTLVAAVKHAGLVDTLSGHDAFTVFAPTDAAFAALPEGTLENLLKPENRDLLTSILTYHVVPGTVTAKDVVKLDFAPTANGQRLPVRVEEGAVTVAGAAVTATDIRCSNGVIHVIDSVMLPETKDLVEKAVAAGTFKTLAAALEAGQLVGALQGEGPFTVFAPTDEAFAKLPQATLQDLLKPESRAQLQRILKYHVVPGRVYANDAVEAGTASTLAGEPLRATIRDGRLVVGGARVVASDLEASNGVIHVVDAVLLPN